MSARDDYLWSGRGRDAELQALERLLAPLAHRPSPLPPLGRQLPPRRRWPLPLAAAAAALLGGAIWWWSTSGAGTPGALAPGAAPQVLVAKSEPRRIALVGVGELELAPGSVLQLQEFSPELARFQLQQGRLVARILPSPQVPPRFFQVATEAADCIDLGCHYELEVRPKGRAHVEVHDGQVEFAFQDRTVYVPAGAECTADPGRGPGLPVFRDARPELRKAVERFEMLDAAPAAQRLQAAVDLFAACRENGDTLPVWHLLRDREPKLRDLAERTLLDLAGEPPTPSGKGGGWEPEEWKAFLRLQCWSTAR